MGSDEPVEGSDATAAQVDEGQPEYVVAEEVVAEVITVEALELDEVAEVGDADGSEVEFDADADAAAEPKPAPLTDGVLLASVELARAALLEITPSATIGEVVGSVAEEDHVLSLHFESKLAGYPGWHWTVTLGRIDESSDPSVLEVEMLPGEQALIAPDWTPWSERLAEYQLAQELAAATAAADSDDDDDHDDDHDDLDEDDLDDETIDLDDHVQDDDELAEADAAADDESDDDESEDDNESDDDDESDDDEPVDAGESDGDDFDDDDFDDDDDDDDDPHAESYSAGR